MKKTAFKIFELVLCVGLFVGVVGYYRFATSAEFNPTAARDFNRNIVEAKNNQKKESDNSTEGNLWKKDENSMDNESSGADNTSDYTKKNDAEETPEENNSNRQTVVSSTVNSKEEKPEDNSQTAEDKTEEGKKTADTVYDIVDGKDNTDKKPDIIIPSDDNSSSTVPAGKDDNKTPDNGSVIIKPGDDNKNTDAPGGGTGDNDKPVTKPEYVPTEEIKDPEPVKDDNKYKGGGATNAKPYVDGVVSDDSETTDTYKPIVDVTVSGSAFYQIIAGETYSDLYFFYALDTLLYVNADFAHPYAFYGKDYGSEGSFMITGVSLDGGNSWIEKFPITIPANQTQPLKIKYAYRFSNKSEWTEEVMWDEMPVYESRIYILNQKVSDDNLTISPDNVLNQFNQYKSQGDLVFVNYYQKSIFENNNWIDESGYNAVLFPGWVEDGKPVGSYYTVTKGRHVLQPMNTVAVPEGVNVKLNSYFLDPYDSLEYLQTLTSFDKTSMQSLLRRNGSSRTVYVPEYIQAIDLDQSPATTCAWMEIPNTVMYIDEDTAPLYVTNGFIVDEDNPYYTSSEEGLLLSKDETEILAIPSAKTSITIEPGVKTVHFSRSSSVKEITILANSLDEFPEMDLSKLDNATLHIQSSVLNEFVKENYDVLEDSGITVTTVADEDRSYIFDNNLQIGNDKGLYHSYVTADTLALSNNISVVKSGAFSDSSVNTLILPEDGKVIDFEKGSLSGSSVNKVICYTQKQYDEVSSYLNEDGLTGVSTVLSATVKTEKYEYQYYVENDVYTLVKAITSPEVFDGTMTLDDNTVAFTEISAGAFKGNNTLKMVNLNESVKKIGAQAFMNCTNLEGVLINSTDTITIGDKLVDGCSKLRYMASNAPTGVMENGYGPNIRDSYGNSTFYVPTDSEGYNNTTSFTAASGVFGYAIIDNNMLYGLDMTMSPFLLLRAGHASGTVNIEPGTQEIIWCAFENLADPFTVSFESLDEYYSNLYIDSRAFANSGITEVTINKGVIVDDEAFSNCSDLQNVALNGEVALRDFPFINCSNLESVTLGTLDDGSLRPNMFLGCDNLKELNLNGYYDYYTQAPSLMVNQYTLFRFNTDWTDDEELEHLRINLGEDIQEDELVDKWKFSFIGYFSNDDSAYTELWSEMQFELMDFDTFELPTTEEVDAAVKQKLLESENRIRRLLGSETVEEPLAYVLYDVTKTNMEGNVVLKTITVRDISGPTDNVDFDDRMDLPIKDNQFYEFVLNEGAFRNCPDVKGIFLPSSSFTTMKDGVLSGVNTDTVGIWNTMGPIPELEVKEEGVPYSFGIEDERVSFLTITDIEEFYEEWQYAMVGYSSQESFEAAMKKELKEEQPELEEDSDEYKSALEEKENAKLEEAHARIDKVVKSVWDLYGNEADNEGEVSE